MDDEMDLAEIFEGLGFQVYRSEDLIPPDTEPPRTPEIVMVELAANLWEAMTVPLPRVDRETTCSVIFALLDEIEGYLYTVYLNQEEDEGVIP